MQFLVCPDCDLFATQWKNAVQANMWMQKRSGAKAAAVVPAPEPEVCFVHRAYNAARKVNEAAKNRHVYI